MAWFTYLNDLATSPFRLRIAFRVACQFCFVSFICLSFLWETVRELVMQFDLSNPVAVTMTVAMRTKFREHNTLVCPVML